MRLPQDDEVVPSSTQEDASSTMGKSSIDVDERDQKTLNQLATAHYIVAVITVAKVLLGLPMMLPGYAGLSDGGQSVTEVPSWFLVGVKWMALLYDMPQLEDDPLFVALMLFMVGAVICTISVVHGAALVWVGRCIRKRKKFKTLLFFSWMDIIYVPFGMVLAIAVIVLFRRPAVRASFGIEPLAQKKK